MDTWIIVFWICGGFACVLFALQSVFWTMMRMKRLTITRWRHRARRLRLAGIVLLAAGGILWGIGGHARNPAWISLFGGSLNVLVASFHLAIVTYLARPVSPTRTKAGPGERE